MAEDKDLPGWPKKALVKRVRSALGGYGIKPSSGLYAQRIWRLTWAWAAEIAKSYQRFDSLLQKRYRERWPSEKEIATQYVVLMLADMQSGFWKLPFRAAEHVPEAVKAHLAQPATMKALVNQPRGIEFFKGVEDGNECSNSHSVN